MHNCVKSKDSWIKKYVTRRLKAELICCVLSLRILPFSSVFKYFLKWMLQRKPYSTGCQESCFGTGNCSFVRGSAGINWLGLTDGISLLWNVLRHGLMHWYILMMIIFRWQLPSSGGAFGSLEPYKGSLWHQKSKNCDSVTHRNVLADSDQVLVEGITRSTATTSWVFV